MLTSSGQCRIVSGEKPAFKAEGQIAALQYFIHLIPTCIREAI